MRKISVLETRVIPYHYDGSEQFAEYLSVSLTAFFKRSFDIIFALIIIMTVLIWLIPLIILIISMESKGNPFFIQKRSGKNNAEFSCYKFRTMKINSTPEKQATYNDSRITRFGRFLRYSGLDEIPQFLNVLIGDMSVVGPRPHMLVHDQQFSKQVSNYNKRQQVKPGITGLAQTRGYRGQIRHLSELKARIKHDLFYIDNYNMKLDMYIVTITVLNMFKGINNGY